MLCVNLPRSIVTDHYLLDLMLIISPKILEEGTLDPANNYLLDHVLGLRAEREFFLGLVLLIIASLE